MSEISDNINNIRKLKSEAAKRAGRDDCTVKLMAVTKTRTADEVNEAINSGINDIGENKVQELIEKYDYVNPVNWHFIGHLQTNKVKYIIDKVCMIHSVDRINLAEEIDKRAKKSNRIMNILIEINLGREETKSGIYKEELYNFIDDILKGTDNIIIRGIMCIPPRFDDKECSRTYFKEANKIFNRLKKSFPNDERIKIDTLSMGMSNDFEVAIEEGSTIIRVGSSIFGKRNYR